MSNFVNYPPLKSGKLLVFASTELLMQSKHRASLT